MSFRIEEPEFKEWKDFYQNHLYALPEEFHEISKQKNVLLTTNRTADVVESCLEYQHDLELFIVLVAAMAAVSDALVIGIDLGSQSFKIGVIKPGAFEIVLNEQSGRKTLNQVGWFREERVFASDAYNLWVRNPTQVYSLYGPLLGSAYKEGALEEIGLGSLAYEVEKDEKRGAFNVKYEDGVTYTPEELAAMVFRKVKELSTAYVRSAVKDCVIAVPVYLNQQQRQAVLDAAALAGLNVLSLVNDVNAASINFAMDRTFDKNQTAVFYDMGAKSTKLSLVTLSSTSEAVKGAKKNRTVTYDIVKALEWDQHLGGIDFDMAIVNHLKAIIRKQNPSIDVSEKRLTIKLVKEASKMKETLSANQQASVFIGSLSGDYDFSAVITRAEFEEISASLFERAVAPLQRLLESNGLTPTDIDFIEMIGGCTRIPGVQQAIKTYMKRQTLDKHLNGDEAIANGAAFYAASLTTYFKVKDIRLKDITPYAVDVKIMHQHEEELDAPKLEVEDDNESETAATSVFRRNNRINVKKTMSFVSDAPFSLNVTNPEQSANIAVYTVSGLPVPSESLNFTGKPKVHCIFRLNTNGMVLLEKAEAEIAVTTSRQRNITQNSTIGESSADATATTPTTTTELITKVVRLPLNVTVVHQGVQPLTKEEFATYNTRINTLDTKDKSLRDLRHERNNLESYLYDTRDKLDSEDVVKCSSETERQNFITEIETTSTWMNDANDNDLDDVSAYQTQLKDLKKKGEKIFARVNQMQQIPSGLEELENLIEKIQPVFTTVSKDLNVTQEEIEEGKEKIATISKWVQDKKEEFQVADFSKDLSFSTMDIKFKFFDLERLVKEFSKKKKKIPPPPKKPAPKKEEEKAEPTSDATIEENQEETTIPTTPVESNVNEETNTNTDTIPTTDDTKATNTEESSSPFEDDIGSSDPADTNNNDNEENNKTHDEL
eukprot:gene16947-20160_t